MLRNTILFIAALIVIQSCEIYFHDRLPVYTRIVNKTDAYEGRNAFAYVRIENESYKDIYDVNGYITVYRDGYEIDRTAFDIDWIEAGEVGSDKVYFLYLERFNDHDEIRIRAEYEDEDGQIHRLYDYDY